MQNERVMTHFLRNAACNICVTPISTAVGAEGQCHRIKGRPNESAKIYNHPIPDDLVDRLPYEINNPPTTIERQVAWPKDIVEDGCDRVVGYLQTHFPPAYVPFTDICSPTIRPRWATGPVLRQCAHEAAHILAELHAYGYLFPDIHADQFLIAKGRSAVLIDAASCQFTDGATLFPCNRVREEYQAPELLDNQNWAEVADRRDEYTDAWSLAVLVFQLAMGCHPFDSVYRGQGPIPSRVERIKRGLFPFDQQCQECQPPPDAPVYRHVAQELRDLFHRCFVDGHLEANRTRRPTAAEWADTLRHCPKLATAPSHAPMPQARYGTPSWQSTVTALGRTVADWVARVFRTARPTGMQAVIACLLLLAGIVATDYFRADSNSSPDPVPHDLEVLDIPPIYRSLPNRDPFSPDVEPILKRIRARIAPTQKEPDR